MKLSWHQREIEIVLGIAIVIVAFSAFIYEAVWGGKSGLDYVGYFLFAALGVVLIRGRGFRIEPMPKGVSG